MKLSPELEAKCLELAGETAPPPKTRKHVPPKPAPVCRGTEARVCLPMPPSANALFVQARGRRVKSQEYRDWVARALPLCKRLAPPPSLPCTFFFVIEGAVNECRDGDNLIKPLVDLAVRAGVVPGDTLRHVRSWYGMYQPHAGTPAVNIWFEPFGAEVGGE